MSPKYDPFKDTVQDRKPNFRANGKLYLVRCFACPGDSERGRENYMMAAASGQCAWCGWSDPYASGESAVEKGDASSEENVAIPQMPNTETK